MGTKKEITIRDLNHMTSRIMDRFNKLKYGFDLKFKKVSRDMAKQSEEIKLIKKKLRRSRLEQDDTKEGDLIGKELE